MMVFDLWLNVLLTCLIIISMIPGVAAAILHYRWEMEERHRGKR